MKESFQELARQRGLSINPPTNPPALCGWPGNTAANDLAYSESDISDALKGLEADADLSFEQFCAGLMLPDAAMSPTQHFPTTPELPPRMPPTTPQSFSRQNFSRDVTTIPGTNKRQRGADHVTVDLFNLAEQQDTDYRVSKRAALGAEARVAADPEGTAMWLDEIPDRRDVLAVPAEGQPQGLPSQSSSTAGFRRCAFPGCKKRGALGWDDDRLEFECGHAAHMVLAPEERGALLEYVVCLLCKHGEERICSPRRLQGRYKRDSGSHRDKLKAHFRNVHPEVCQPCQQVSGTYE